MNGAIYVEGSKNSKLAGSKPIDGTYTSIKATCSPTCPLKITKTCYGTLSYVGLVNRRMNKRARGGSPLALARAEAKCIDVSYNGGTVPADRDVRLHISGDSRSIKGTRVLAKAITRWKKRGGRNAFTYTHSWAHVPRKEWGPVSVLASIESTSQVAAARKNGYACAIVVSEHLSEKSYSLPGSDVVWVPCPAQTKPGGKDVHCSDCRLCMKSDYLLSTNRGIAFSVHGIRKNDLKRHLNVINE